LAVTPPPPAITADPLRRSGKPCVRNLRISGDDVLGWLEMGMTSGEIVADYPELTPQDILAWQAWAAARPGDLCTHRAES
jgi:uncharacterized protein (DUF433 family)